MKVEGPALLAVKEEEEVEEDILLRARKGVGRGDSVRRAQRASGEGRGMCCS